MGETTKIEWADHTKLCSSCRQVKPLSSFPLDSSRKDGFGYRCKACRSTGRPRGWHGKPNVNPVTGRPGPAPMPARDGDKQQARQRVNVEVRTGRRPHPNSLPCTDCGQLWQVGRERHEYDHHKGYAAAHHLDVEPVCSPCHHQREEIRRGR